MDNIGLKIDTINDLIQRYMSGFLMDDYENDVDYQFQKGLIEDGYTLFFGRMPDGGEGGDILETVLRPAKIDEADGEWIMKQNMGNYD
jgi:hypothetical protein